MPDCLHTILSVLLFPYSPLCPDFFNWQLFMQTAAVAIHFSQEAVKKKIKPMLCFSLSIAIPAHNPLSQALVLHIPAHSQTHTHKRSHRES